MDRSKLDSFITDIENAAYARGVEDTLARIKDAIAAVEVSATTSILLAKETADRPSLAVAVSTPNTEPRRGSDQLLVLGDIRLNPGSRGIDIVNRLDGQVHERTVRTSLHRLRKRGAIIQQDDKWFAATTEPGVTGNKMIESRGGQTPETSGIPSGGMAERPNAADSKSVGES